MEEGLFMAIFNAFILIGILVYQLFKSRINSNNLLGIEVPENKIKSNEVEKIIKGFRKENILIGVMSMVLITSFIYFIDNIIFLVASIAIYSLILLIIYLRWHKKLDQLRKKEKWDKQIKKENSKKESDSISQKLFLIPLFIILINIAIALLMYPILPDKLPIHWKFQGDVDGYMTKSIIGVLLIPLMQLFLAIVIYLIYITIKKGKNHKNPRDPERSLKKGLIFKKVWSWYFIVTLTLVEILLTILNMMTFGFIKDIKLFNLFSFIITGLIIVGAIILSLVMGQGGDRLKVKDEDDYLKDKNLDDSFWKLGNLLYFNPEDPTIFVEKRVGLGWTVNLGRPSGVVLMVFPIIIVFVALIFTK